MKKFLVKEILLKHYWSAKKIKLKNYRLNLTDQAIVIYTMGKVGSWSFFLSIKNKIIPANPELSAFFIHYLNDENLRKAEREEKKSFAWTKEINNYLVEGRFLNKHINNGYDYKRKFKIITGVRDIVSAHVSDFFQNLYRNQHFDYSKIKSERNGDLLKELTDLFWKYLKEYEHKWELWFDEELNSVLGFDVFSAAFPKETGYKIYEGDHPDALVYRLEDLSKVVTPSIKDFLGIENFKLIRANRGEDKDYADVYKTFISNISFPEGYLERMYATDFMRHFYTPSEISGFYDKWNK